jgi:hypothetical protein
MLEYINDSDGTIYFYINPIARIISVRIKYSAEATHFRNVE